MTWWWCGGEALRSRARNCGTVLRLVGSGTPVSRARTEEEKRRGRAGAMRSDAAGTRPVCPRNVAPRSLRPPVGL